MPQSRGRLLAPLLVAVLLPFAAAAALIGPVPRPAPPGIALANLAARLDPADPRRGQPIRVLFYGQSITRQDWWQGVAAHLLRRFPHERFEFRNLAIGGHDAARLMRLVEADVLPYQPDLVVFHVYGDPGSLAETVRRIRAGTVADVLVATDHLVRDDERTEETRPWALVESGLVRRIGRALHLLPAGSTWQAWRNHAFLPALAARYGLGLLDVRTGWRRALDDAGARAADVLADDLHLNARGVRLMEQLVVAELDRLVDRDLSPAGVATPHRTPRVRAVPADCRRPAAVEGYRADVLGGDRTPPRGEARIDGARLETLAALYWAGRASLLPGTDFPGLLQVRVTGPRVVAGRYTVRLLEREGDGAYRVAVTLPGGGHPVTGRSDQPLLLVRQGLRIDPADWNLAYAESVFGIADFAGQDITFQVHAPGGLRPAAAAPGVTMAPPAPADRAGPDAVPGMLYRAPTNAGRALCVPGLSDPGARLVEYRAPLSCPFGWTWACRLETGT